MEISYQKHIPAVVVQSMLTQDCLPEGSANLIALYCVRWSGERTEQRAEGEGIHIGQLGDAPGIDQLRHMLAADLVAIPPDRGQENVRFQA
jgi:hypothetical protein